MRTRHFYLALVMVLALVAAACGGSDESGGDGAAIGTSTTIAASNDQNDDLGDDQGSDQGSDQGDDGVNAIDDQTPSDSGGVVDGSDIDWGSFDLTAVDWVNIDMATIDFEAISDNPTAADLDDATRALIGSRMFAGSAILTIGGEVWEFDNFVCAFGHENTESTVYSFTSNSFGEHSDGTRVQMQANVRNVSGDGRVEGDGLVHETFVNDIEDFENPVVDWQINAPVGITLDGDLVTVAGQFDSGLTDEVEAVPGTLEAECGTDSRR